MSDHSHTCVFYSDDEPDGEGPRLELTFSEDYYLAVIPPGDRASTHSIRFRNSGARRPDVTHAVALLRAVIRSDKQAIVDMSLSLWSLAGCKGIKPTFHQDPRADQAEVESLRALLDLARLKGTRLEAALGKILDVAGPHSSGVAREIVNIADAALDAETPRVLDDIERGSN